MPSSAAVLLLVLVPTCCLVGPGAALNFLFLPFMGANSPSLDLMGVAAQLQARGHSVMVVVTEGGKAFAKMAAARHGSNTTAESLQYVTYQMEGDPAQSVTSSLQHFAEHPGRYSSGMLLMSVQNMLALPCAALLNDPQAMERIRAFQADAVAGIGLPMLHSDSCGCVLSHLLGMPYIDINGHPIIDSPPTVPQFGSGLTQQSLWTVTGLARNLMVWTMRITVPTLLMDFGHNPWHALRKETGLPQAQSRCLLTNGLTRLKGQHSRQCQGLVEVILGSWLLEYPRPLAAHQRLVGPGTPRPAHPIQPQDVADFVADATAGLVLVAFGSTVQSMVMSQQDFTELSEGFAALAPIRVLWAVTEQGLPTGLHFSDLPLGSNTKVVPWVDYNDVLGHPNTKVLVSHCGIHSVYEAVYHGVPVVAVPFQFEQAEHASKLASRGLGIVSRESPAFRYDPRDPRHYTRQHISGLIHQVLSNESYAASAGTYAQALQTYAARRHPYQRAADEIELELYTAQINAASGSASAGAVTRVGVAAAAAVSTAGETDAERRARPREEL